MVSHTRSKAMLFCEGSSIRGMQKIIKARTRFLRVLWILFVFIMTCVLLVTSAFLVKDYLNYDTAWHTTKKIDARAPFPAITVCSHNPFSLNVNKWWDGHRLKTPSQVSAQLLNMSIRGIKTNEKELATAYLFDKIDTYYMAIRSNETVVLGHNTSMMRYCMVVRGGFNTVSERCAEPDMLGVQLQEFSHANYFNCYTVEGISADASKDIEELYLLVALTPTSEIPEMKNNFVMDMLSRGEGLILTIHERGHYPDVTRNGLSVEPGKMNEFTYDTTYWKRLSTPKVRCYDHQSNLRDLDKEYLYNFRQCLESKIQEYLIKKCSCMSALYPRIQPVSDKVPYCMKIGNVTEWKKRVECASEVVTKEKVLKQKFESTECYPRCHFSSYSLSPSITNWRPSATKLDTLTRRYRSLSEVWIKMSNKSVTLTDRERKGYIDKILPNFKNRNTSSYSELFSSDRFCFIKFARRNFDITIKVEKLVFDVNILASRIGGLCSLCIGLTAAFVMELVEFMYLYFQLPKSNGSPSAGQTPGTGLPESLRTRTDGQYFPSGNHKNTHNSHRYKSPHETSQNPGYPINVTHRSRTFNYNPEDDGANDMLRLTGYEGQFGVSNNHYSDSPWFRMTHEGSCHACGRGLPAATPISSV